MPGTPKPRLLRRRSPGLIVLSSTTGLSPIQNGTDPSLLNRTNIFFSSSSTAVRARLRIVPIVFSWGEPGASNSNCFRISFESLPPLTCLTTCVICRIMSCERSLYPLVRTSCSAVKPDNQMRLCSSSSESLSRPDFFDDRGRRLLNLADSPVYLRRTGSVVEAVFGCDLPYRVGVAPARELVKDPNLGFAPGVKPAEHKLGNVMLVRIGV
jgi:hypothetical protein